MSKSGNAFPEIAFSPGLAAKSIPGSAASVNACPLCASKPQVTMRAARNNRRPRKQRPDAPSNSENTGAEKPSTHRNPQRVRVNSTTPSLREQLQFIKTRTEKKKPRSDAVRTSFRRSKAETVLFHAHRRKQLVDESVPDGKYSLEEAPILFIDGYNVIGQWARLKKHRNRGDLMTARQMLLHDVTEFSHIRGWSCVLVFDAYGNGTTSLCKLLSISFSPLTTFRVSLFQRTPRTYRRPTSSSRSSSPATRRPTRTSSAKCSRKSSAARGKCGRRRMTGRRRW